MLTARHARLHAVRRSAARRDRPEAEGRAMSELARLDPRPLASPSPRRAARCTCCATSSSTSARAGSSAIVGESGSGKSTLALALLGLLPANTVAARRRNRVRRREPAGAARRARCERLRGTRIAMIFQDPMTALNPVFTSGRSWSTCSAASIPDLGRRQLLRRAAEDAGTRRHRRRRQRGSRLSASVLRRHAPAHHDRHGAALPSRTS